MAAMVTVSRNDILYAERNRIYKYQKIMVQRKTARQYDRKYTQI